jgi:3-methyladenine DNA glycosylase/8-oxoguanine DNA glycosylase
MGEKWRPYRSIATWYLWRSRDGDNQKLLDDWG